MLFNKHNTETIYLSSYFPFLVAIFEKIRILILNLVKFWLKIVCIHYLLQIALHWIGNCHRILVIQNNIWF